MTVGLYVRVSTEDQSLDRQIEKGGDYAEGRLGVSLNDVEVYRDKSTGTNTDRSGYKALKADCEAGEIDTVIISSISRVSRGGPKDLDRTLEWLRESGTTLHTVDEGLKVEPDELDAMQWFLIHQIGLIAAFEAKMIQQRTQEAIAAKQNTDEYTHGPAPLGFEKDDGSLIEDENHSRVCSVLEMVLKDELSKRKAAKELDTSRKSIDRALERGELYGL